MRVATGLIFGVGTDEAVSSAWQSALPIGELNDLVEHSDKEVSNGTGVREGKIRVMIGVATTLGPINKGVRVGLISGAQ